LICEMLRNFCMGKSSAQKNAGRSACATKGVRMVLAVSMGIPPGVCMCVILLGLRFEAFGYY
jgi:hypothetical protein